MNSDVFFQIGSDKPITKQKFITGVIFIFLMLFFIVFTFVPSWIKLNTDFSNSYVASRLVLDGVNTEDIYNPTWFQRQMNYYGVEVQLGGFIPLHPFSALVMTPIAYFRLEPLQAKHVWLILNLVFMFLSTVMIRKFTGYGLVPITIFFLLSGVVLRNNFLFGQMYMLMLLSVTASLYFYQKGNDILGGLALAFGIVARMFPIFILFYFLWKRQWRIALYTIIGILAFNGLSIHIMGLNVYLTYLREIQPSTFDGMVVDPYSTFYQSINSLLHRLFVYEPSLNPEPILDVPPLYVFFKILFYVSILFLTLVTIDRRIDHRSSTRVMVEFGLFLILALLLAPATLTYTYLLWILPMAIFTNVLHSNKRYGLLILFFFLYLITGTNIINLASRYNNGLNVFLVYPRLWITLIIFIIMLFAYKGLYPRMHSAQTKGVIIYSIAGVTAIFMILGSRHYFTGKADESLPLRFEHSLYISTAPTVSNDKLIFCGLTGKRYALMDENGTLESQFPGNAFTPKHSKKGDIILFEGVKDGQSRLYLYRKGESPLPITEPSLNAHYPAFRGDSNEIAFVSNHTGDSDIYFTDFRRGDPSGRPYPTQPLPLVATSAEEIEPSFSPDGNKLVYASNLTGSYKLYIMDFIDRSTKQITFGSSTERRPCWSPDGKYIAFTSNKSGNWDIWVYAVFSSSLRQITKDRGHDDYPCWSYDSSYIIFASDRWRGVKYPALYAIRK